MSADVRFQAHNQPTDEWVCVNWWYLQYL